MGRLSAVIAVACLPALVAGAACTNTNDCPATDSQTGGDEASLLQHQKPPTKRGPKYTQKPRVRREWRTLSPEIQDKVVNAFWTLKKLNTTYGQSLYGPHFHNHDDMLILHSCSVMDPRCDQGHFGPHFMTFHRALLLKYELALLSVEPDIFAMPYWNIAYDSVNGKYRNDPDKYFFTDKYIGAFYGQGPDHEVENGRFANWPVEHWTRQRFGNESELVNQDGHYNRCIDEEWFVPQPCNCSEDECPRLLRASSHEHCAEVVARWPEDPNGQKMTNSDGIAMNPNGQGGTFEIVYSEDDFDKCACADRTPTWMAWQNCVELSTISCFVPGSKEYDMRNRVLPSLVTQAGAKSEAEKQDMVEAMKEVVEELMEKVEPNCTDSMLLGYWLKLGKSEGGKGNFPFRGHSPYFHSQAHIKFGIDLLDVTTSPNEAAAFTGYHADIDRNNFHWMYNSRHLGQATKWTYPTSQNQAAAFAKSGLPPYGSSGPYGLYDRAMCANGKAADYTGDTPWLPGTLWDDVVNSGFAFYNLFPDYDGGDKGYTHGDILTLSSPDRTPYTYDTLEHLYYDV